MYKDITTVEQAFAAQKDKIDLSQLPDLSSLPAKFSRGMLALLKLQVATEAVNNDDPAVPDWEPDYNNEDQRKWFPWYVGGDKSGAGFRFYVSVFWWTYSLAHGGARLACKDKARADHMNAHFQELYKELYLILQ